MRLSKTSNLNVLIILLAGRLKIQKESATSAANATNATGDATHIP